MRGRIEAPPEAAVEQGTALAGLLARVTQVEQAGKREIGAGGIARQHHAIRVDAQTPGLGADPADRRDAVVERRRKRVFGRHAVVDPDHRRIAVQRQQPHHAVVGVERAQDEAAAMEVDHQRQGRGLARPVVAQPDRAAGPGHRELGHAGERRRVLVPGPVALLGLGARRLGREIRERRQAGLLDLAQDQGGLGVDVDPVRGVAHRPILHTQRMVLVAPPSTNRSAPWMCSASGEAR